MKYQIIFLAVLAFSITACEEQETPDVNVDSNNKQGVVQKAPVAMLDTTSEASFEKTTLAVRNALSEADKQQFDEVVQSITKYYMVKNLFTGNVALAKSQAADVLHGHTAKEIFELGKEYKQKLLEQETRSKVVEAVSLLYALKTPTEEWVAIKNTWVADLKTFGLETSGEYTESISSDPENKTYIATIKKDVALIGGKTLQLSLNTKQWGWTCRAGSVNPIEEKYLPSSCQSK